MGKELTARASAAAFCAANNFTSAALREGGGWCVRSGGGRLGGGREASKLGLRSFNSAFKEFELIGGGATVACDCKLGTGQSFTP